MATDATTDRHRLFRLVIGTSGTGDSGFFVLCLRENGALTPSGPPQSRLHRGRGPHTTRRRRSRVAARRPTSAQLAALAPAWRPVLQANDLPGGRYVLSVLPSNELNAFACGGHLVVVTSYAIEALPRDELTGVLAHELSHHLGLHTLALTLVQWLSVPVLLLARIGFFLQNVASAATTSYGSNSSALTVFGRTVAALLTAISWVLLSGLLLSNALANIVGRNSEFEADMRAIDMGFGKPLSTALRRFVAEFGADRPLTWRERLASSHPPARTRVARIDATMRRRRLRPSPESGNMAPWL